MNASEPSKRAKSMRKRFIRFSLVFHFSKRPSVARDISFQLGFRLLPVCLPHHWCRHETSSNCSSCSVDRHEKKKLKHFCSSQFHFVASHTSNVCMFSQAALHRHQDKHHISRSSHFCESFDGVVCLRFAESSERRPNKSDRRRKKKSQKKTKQNWIWHSAFRDGISCKLKALVSLTMLNSLSPEASLTKCSRSVDDRKKWNRQRSVFLTLKLASINLWPNANTFQMWHELQLNKC